MRIAVVHGNDGSDVRIGKVCRSLSKMGHETHFIGWDRRPLDEKSIDLGHATRNVLLRGTRYGKATLAGHLAFMAYVIGMLRKVRPDVLACVNEEAAFLLLPFRGILYRYLVCDVFDALADRHSNKSKALHILLSLVSEIVRWRTDRLIATDAERAELFGRYKAKVEVVENVPEDPGEDLSLRFPAGKVKICVAGSLMERRGLRYLIEAVEGVEDAEIISAGWLYDSFAEKEFVHHPKVTFMGVLTARKCLEMTSSCDAVFSFYDPLNISAIYASPNKIYDAMSVGRPILINSEIRVSKYVVEQGLGWTCGYQDVSALATLVRGLTAHRGSLSAFARRVRALYLQSFTWEAMEERLRTLYDGLAAR